jgi:hypothetical protein
VTAAAAWVAAKAQRMRDGLEAGMLAGELGCEVTAHPELAGRVEAWEPLPGLARPRKSAGQWRPNGAGAHCWHG